MAAMKFLPSGGTATYYYDLENYRYFINEPLNGVSTVYYGAYGEHFNTVNQNGNNDLNYYFGTTPVYHKFAGATGYTAYNTPVWDQLGSLRAFSAYPTGMTNYYPYGQEYTTTSQNQEKFATYIRDSFSGLDYALSRTYSSALGIFVGGSVQR
jgi:hypothetical protein